MLTTRRSALSDFGDVVPDADGILRLRKGDTAPEVEDWQNNLIRMGFDVGITGNFDDATLAATVAFQKTHRLTANGIVEDATRGAMADELDKLELPKPAGVNTEAPPPPITFDPVEVKGRFPSLWWLLLPIGAALAWKKRKR